MSAPLLRLALALLASATIANASPLGPDGEPGRVHPGKFIWLDLAAEDPAVVRPFYAAVFGWRFRPVADAPTPYEVIEGPRGKVGGLFRKARPAGAPVGSRWLGLISVRDVTAAAEYVRRNGGSVLVPPTAIGGRGTHAVFRDPQGAVFGVLAASGGDPPDDPVSDGEVFWMDLFVASPTKAVKFYAGLAGYEAVMAQTQAGRLRWILATGDVARAGVVPVEGKSGPGWLPYVLVDDVDEAMKRARAAGGRVVLEPRADLLDRNLAVIADPLGGVVGILNWVARVEPQR